MKDSVTGKPIVVSTDGDVGPYIAVPSDQEDAVRTILNGNGHSFGVDKRGGRSDASGWDSVFNLGDGADTDAIQQLLDDAE